MQQTLRPSIFFPLPQCRGHLGNDHPPRRPMTDSCAITLWPEASCALHIILCSELQQDQAYQSTAVSTRRRGKVQMETTTENPVGALGKREEPAGDSESSKEKGVGWSPPPTDCTRADAKLHQMFLQKSALSFLLPGHLLDNDVLYKWGKTRRND